MTHPSADFQSIVAQLDSVIAQYNKEGGPPPEYDPELERQTMGVLMTRCVAAIDRAAPDGTAYARAAADVLSQNLEDHQKLPTLIGVVRALREDYIGGFMRRVEELIHAVVFDDFLEMASELLSKGYKDPAAVIGGSVLEEHLRKLAARAGITVVNQAGSPLKTDRINADLVKASVYNALDQKSVTAWLGLRNKAAHGEYDVYDASHVDLMLQGIRGFVARHPA